MKPLTLHRQILTWLCLFSFDEDTNKWKKIGYITFGIMINAIALCGITSSVVHFLTFLSVNLEECLFSLMQIIASSSNFYGISIAFISRHKTLDIFNSLTEIFNASKDYFQINKILITLNLFIILSFW